MLCHPNDLFRSPGSEVHFGRRRNGFWSEIFAFTQGTGVQIRGPNHDIGERSCEASGATQRGCRDDPMRLSIKPRRLSTQRQRWAKQPRRLSSQPNELATASQQGWRGHIIGLVGRPNKVVGATQYAGQANPMSFPWQPNRVAGRPRRFSGCHHDVFEQDYRAAVGSCASSSPHSAARRQNLSGTQEMLQPGVATQSRSDDKKCDVLDLLRNDVAQVTHPDRVAQSPWRVLPWVCAATVPSDDPSKALRRSHPGRADRWPRLRRDRTRLPGECGRAAPVAAHQRVRRASDKESRDDTARWNPAAEVCRQNSPKYSARCGDDNLRQKGMPPDRHNAVLARIRGRHGRSCRARSRSATFRWTCPTRTSGWSLSGI